MEKTTIFKRSVRRSVKKDSGKKQKSAGRKLIKCLVLFGMFAVLLFFLAALFLPKLVDTTVYRESLEQWLSYEFARDVTAKDIEINLINGSKIILKDLTIMDDPAFSEEPFLISKEAVLSVKFFPIIRGELVIDGIVFVEADLSIIKDSKGKYNIESLGNGNYTNHNGENLPPTDLSGFFKLPFKEKSTEIERIAFTDSVVSLNRIGDDDITEEILKFEGLDVALEDLKPQENGLLSGMILQSDVDDRNMSNISALFRSSKLPSSGKLTINNSLGTFLGIPFEEVKLNATIRDNVFKVDEMSFKLFGGVVKSKGFIDLSGKVPELVINSSIAGSMANKLIGIITSNDETFFGKTTFEGTFTGKGKTIDEMKQKLSGEGIFRIEDGIIPAFSIRTELLSLGIIPRNDLPEDLDTRFSIIGGIFLLSDGKFKTSTIVLKTSEWDAFARGSLSMDGKIEVKGNIFLADSMAVELKSEYIPSFIKNAVGRFSIPFTFSLTGDIENPEFSLRPKFLMKKNADEIFEDFKRELEQQNQEEHSIKFINY